MDRIELNDASTKFRRIIVAEGVFDLIEDFSARSYDHTYVAIKTRRQQGDGLYDAADVFLKRDDISEESKQRLLIDNTARFYGL